MKIPFRMSGVPSLLLLAVLFSPLRGGAEEKLDLQKLQPLLKEHCLDCHDADSSKGGLDLTQLGSDVSRPADFAQWERNHERVRQGEMPPPKKNRMSPAERDQLLREVAGPLAAVHRRVRGTVLRRLNRVEYENTLNDLFGTRLELASTLPEDGLFHGFDNVGEALSISTVQLQKYLESARLVLDTGLNGRPSQESSILRASYAETREAQTHLGKAWHLNPDGAVVFYKRRGYPSGMLRDANVRASGRYRIRVTGYAHQSPVPITFSVGSTTFARGADKPTYGYFSLPPGNPSTVELEAWIENRYMIQIEPFGLQVDDAELKKVGLEKYKGPGLAILHVELEGPLPDPDADRAVRLVYEGVERREVEPRNPKDKQRSNYVPKYEVVASQPDEDASRILSRVARLAFRRPVQESELKPFLALFHNEINQGGDFDTAMRTALAGILCSPHFLYLVEKPGKLNDHALAARLSYFLQRSLPDADLSRSADEGRLTGEPGALLAQAIRLLKSPKSERFIYDFADAWLDLRNIEFTNPETRLFPEYDEYLLYSMIQESRSFLEELIRKNLPVRNVIDSDFAMLNERLAEHYGIPNVAGPDIRPVQLPQDSPRGGVMAQAAVLKVSSNGTATSPVIRGVWILERILGITPPPPPPAVPGVEPDIRGAQTVRQLLDKHRSMVSCQGCHQLIDAPGFALEAFDPIGGYRNRFRSLGEGDRVNIEVNGRKVQYRLAQPVDASGKLRDDREFQDFNEFKRLLLEDDRDVVRCLVEKVLTFATGRELGFSDEPEIHQMVDHLRSSGGGFRDLILMAVDSEIFRNK